MADTSIDAVVRLMREAERQRPATTLYIGEMEPGPIMRLFDAGGDELRLHRF